MHSFTAPIQEETGVLDRNISISKSRICKRNIPAHGALSAQLGSVLDVLMFGFSVAVLFSLTRPVHSVC